MCRHDPGRIFHRGERTDRDTSIQGTVGLNIREQLGSSFEHFSTFVPFVS